MKKWTGLTTIILALVLCVTPAMAYTLTPNGEFPVVDEKIELTVWSAAPTSIIDMNTNTQTIWYEEHTGVHVNWTLVTEEAGTKMNLSLASGNYPDIYFNAFTSAQTMINVNNGVFIPLNDLINEHSYYYKQILADNPVLEDNLTAPNGNIYTFFRTDSGVHMYSTNKMFVYKPWLDKLGMEVPTTTEEFKNMLLVFRDNDMNGNGDPSDEIPLAGSFSAWGGDPVAFLMNPFQLWNNNFLTGLNNQVEFIANTDAFREGLKYIHELYEEGLIAEATYVQDTTQLKTMINHKSEEEMLVGAFPTAHVAQYVDLELMPNSLVDYAPVPPIEGPAGLRQAESTSYSQISLYGAITSACKTPDVAMRWVDGMIGGEGRERGYYGIAGQHFQWSDDESISGVTPSRTLTFQYMAPDNDWWHNYGIGPVYDTIDFRYEETNVPGWYGWAHYAAHTAYEPYYVKLGFPMVSWVTDEEVAVEMSELKILIDDFVKQSYTQFILGVQDINDDAAWDNYKAQLNAMGIERYVELNQMVNFGQ